MNYKEDIQDLAIILDQIIALFESVNDKRWLKSLKNFREDCEYIENEKEVNDFRRKLLNLFQGGMESFQDIVLCSNDKILPEDDEFDKLKKKLFDTSLKNLS